MRENRLDQEIRDGLLAAADHVEASERCKDRIDAQINCAEAIRSNGGSKNMMKWTWKKAVVAAVACCMLLGGTVFAAGKIVYVNTQSNRLSDVSDYSEIRKLEKAAGYNIRSVENFQNGFKFNVADIADVSGEDEEGNAVSSWKQIDMFYTDDAGRSVFLDTEPEKALNQDLSADKLDEKEIDGKSVYYNCVEYYFVPAGYEATPEELDREKTDPHYTISYGSDTAMTIFYKDVQFALDGVVYLLMTPDDLSAEELYWMAEEIITGTGK